MTLDVKYCSSRRWVQPEIDMKLERKEDRWRRTRRVNQIGREICNAGRKGERDDDR